MRAGQLVLCQSLCLLLSIDSSGVGPPLENSIAEKDRKRKDSGSASEKGGQGEIPDKMSAPVL